MFEEFIKKRQDVYMTESIAFKFLVHKIQHLLTGVITSLLKCQATVGTGKLQYLSNLRLMLDLPAEGSVNKIDR